MALNQRVLAALVNRDGSDAAQIVHHAAQAGDVDAIVRYGPAAARDAARAGAHREAVAHFGLVLEHADRFAADERAGLLEQYAIECYTIGAAERAVGAQRQAVELNRVVGDLRVLGSSLRWLSRMQWWGGQPRRRRAGGPRGGRSARAGRGRSPARACPEQPVAAAHARLSMPGEHFLRASAPPRWPARRAIRR